MLYPLKFIPVFMERIWGGTGLKEEFGKEIPGDKIGESWEITCRREAMSRVAEGPLAGRTLVELIREYGPELLGTGVPAEKDFPMLLKILDARDILSVQVHPDDEFARVHENSLGKTEVWYILKAAPGAKIVYGLKSWVTREDFCSALEEGRLEECLNEVEVAPGEVYPISPGLVHALGAGIMVAELQQNSDITYRVFDWNRVDEEGRSRPLHVEKALQVIDFGSNPPPSLKPEPGRKESLLVDNQHFSLTYLQVAGEEKGRSDPGAFALLMIVAGAGGIQHRGKEYPLRSGDSLMIPASLGEYSLYGNLCVLIGSPKKITA